MLSVSRRSVDGRLADGGAEFGLQEVETCVLRRGLEYGNETTMLPTRMAHEVTAYTPNISKSDEDVELTALAGYHPNGYESNGHALNGTALN